MITSRCGCGDRGDLNPVPCRPPGYIIKDGAITTSKIADGAVTASKIANNTIVGGNIASGTITLDKLTPAIQNAFNSAATSSMTTSEIINLTPLS